MKHWVFDLDGTLVDSLTSHFSILGKIFVHFGAEFTEKNHLEALKLTAQTFPYYLESKLGRDNGTAALGMFEKQSYEAFREVKPFAGISELLQSLKSHGMQLAVWTARDRDAMEEILFYTGLNSYFSVCVSGTCVKEGKPHPEGLQRIADHFGCDREHMIMVGDFDSDMLGAQAFGIKAIRVGWQNIISDKECEIAHWQFNQVSQMNTWIQSEVLSNSMANR